MSLHDVMRAQGTMCESLGSPFMNVLLSVIADNIAPGNEVSARLLNWPGDISGKADSVSLRLAGALHALVLTDKSPELAAQYPPNTPDPEALWQAVEHAFTHHTAHIQDWLNSPPQTNEVRRSSVLIPAAHLIAAHFGKPLALSELGASSGLNLMFDHFGLNAGSTDYTPENATVVLNPDWTGDAPAPIDLQITQRRGVDLNPLDPTDHLDQLRLRAYLWADQPDRLHRTEAAIALASGQVDTGDVEAWLTQRLANPPKDATHMIYHTVAWQYFPAATSAACQTLIEAAGASATADAPLAWFGMEADDDTASGAKLTLRLWPGNITLHLGRADFHGRWVKWTGIT
jgi:hypothetical protein